MLFSVPTALFPPLLFPPLLFPLLLFPPLLFPPLLFAPLPFPLLPPSVVACLYGVFLSRQQTSGYPISHSSTMPAAAVPCASSSITKTALGLREQWITPP